MAEAYKHQEFPKAMYHESGKHVIVASAEQEGELGKGWSDMPGDDHLEMLQKGHAVAALKHDEAKMLKSGKAAEAEETEVEAEAKPRTRRAKAPKVEQPN